MTEAKVQYQTLIDPTDAERWNHLTETAQVLYLLALRHVGVNREIYVANHQELAALIGYGDQFSDWALVEAVREWDGIGLIHVPDEDENGKRRIVFREHELMGGPVCVGAWQAGGDSGDGVYVTECGWSFGDGLEHGGAEYCPICGGELVEVVGVAA